MFHNIILCKSAYHCEKIRVIVMFTSLNLRKCVCVCVCVCVCEVSLFIYLLSYGLFHFCCSFYNQFLLCVSKLLSVSMCAWQCSFFRITDNTDYWRLICYLF